jgi:hypothetical protein
VKKSGFTRTFFLFSDEIIFLEYPSYVKSSIISEIRFGLFAPCFVSLISMYNCLLSLMAMSLVLSCGFLVYFKPVGFLGAT